MELSVLERCEKPTDFKTLGGNDVITCSQLFQLFLIGHT